MADFSQALANLQQQAGYAAGQARAATEAVRGVQGGQALIQQELQRIQRDQENLASAISGIKGSNSFGDANVASNDHVRYIESIPGRRIPFDLLVSIPIGANITSQQQGTKTISQDGPFVALVRYATFQSAYQFSFTDPETQQRALFQGRSFGRFRPIHSMWDITDASAGVFQPTSGIAPPGTGAPIVASPSNHSSFRSMEFDGYITMLNQGAAYPRSNDPVPSAFYSTSINSPFQLAAMDFFERGETIQWQVLPSHVNNPPAGNLSGYAAGGLFPFLDSQYDVHEGINDQLNPAATADPVTRLPDGILVVGLHGLKIIQPPGPVRLT
jgi:hypothetical protein